MRRSDVTVLDCTLRDGGYYTNWEFSDEFVAMYLQACDAAGIDIVELGYISVTESHRGAFASLPSKALSQIVRAQPVSTEMRFAAMLDASEALRCDSWPRWLEHCLELASDPVGLEIVRVAVRYSLLPGIVPIVQALREAGLGVCVNLMQIDLASEADLVRCVTTIREIGHGIDAVYLADSLGGMRPRRVQQLCNRFTASLPAGIALGFHPHDNLGLALHNGLTALDAGATWLDATMYGMGRGAGNVRTELLLTALTNMDQSLLTELYEFIVGYLGPMHDEMRWGTSVLYAMAGMRAIHPTYVQLLTQNSTLDGPSKLRVLRWLVDVEQSEPVSAFRAERLDMALACHVGREQTSQVGESRG